MIRAVVDTNVFASGLLSPSGNEALIILAIHQGLIRPCLSEEIVEKYSQVLARPRFAFPPDEIEALIAMLRHKGELFQPDDSPSASPDPGDTKFLHCASAAQADFLITGNRKHFPELRYGPTRVVSAGEPLDRITLDI